MLLIESNVSALIVAKVQKCDGGRGPAKFDLTFGVVFGCVTCQGENVIWAMVKLTWSEH